MKSEDALLVAWRETLARKGDAPAIFDTRGDVLRTFEQIENRSRELEDSLGKFQRRRCCRDSNWKSRGLAGVADRLLRRELVTLPLEPGMGEQEEIVFLRSVTSPLL